MFTTPPKAKATHWQKPVIMNKPGHQVRPSMPPSLPASPVLVSRGPFPASGNQIPMTRSSSVTSRSASRMSTPQIPSVNLQSTTVLLTRQKSAPSPVPPSQPFSQTNLHAAGVQWSSRNPSSRKTRPVVTPVVRRSSPNLVHPGRVPQIPHVPSGHTIPCGMNSDWRLPMPPVHPQPWNTDDKLPQMAASWAPSPKFCQRVFAPPGEEELPVSIGALVESTDGLNSSSFGTTYMTEVTPNNSHHIPLEHRWCSTNDMQKETKPIMWANEHQNQAFRLSDGNRHELHRHPHPSSVIRPVMWDEHEDPKIRVNDHRCDELHQHPDPSSVIQPVVWDDEPEDQKLRVNNRRWDKCHQHPDPSNVIQPVILDDARKDHKFHVNDLRCDEPHQHPEPSSVIQAIILDDEHQNQTLCMNHRNRDDVYQHPHLLNSIQPHMSDDEDQLCRHPHPLRVAADTLMHHEDSSHTSDTEAHKDILQHAEMPNNLGNCDVQGKANGKEAQNPRSQPIGMQEHVEELAQLMKENEDLKVHEGKQRMPWQNGLSAGFTPGVCTGAVIGAMCIALL